MGDSITFTINVTNIGTATAYNVTITDSLPGFLQNTSLLTKDCGTLNVSESCIFEVNATVIAEAPDATNPASVSGKTITNVPVSNQTESEKINASIKNPLLSIIKHANATDVTVGDSITFTINVTNIGTATAYNVTITDSLPGFLQNTSLLTKDCGTLNVSESCIFEVNATVIAEAPDATNPASVSGKTITNVPVSNQTESEKINASLNEPELSINKVPEYQEIIKGGLAIFYINITNNGKATLYNITLNDTYDYLEFENMNLTSTFNNTIGDLATGNSTVITIKFNTSNAYVNSNYTNFVEVIGHKDNATGSKISKTDSANVYIKPPQEPTYPKLRITKCVNETNGYPDTVGGEDFPDSKCSNSSYRKNKNNTKYIERNFSKGDTVCFVVAVENIGSAPIYNVTFYDILPNNFVPYNLGYQNMTLVSYALAPGRADYKICVNITENASYGWNMNFVHAEGEYENATGGFEKTFDEGNVQIYIPEPPNYPKLSVTKTANQSQVLVGENVTFIINITNNGNTTSFNTTFKDIINLNYSYINITGNITDLVISYPPNYTYITGNLGNIGVNESKAFNITLTIGSKVQAMFLRANVITSYGHYANATGDIVSGTDDEWINITKKEICYPVISVTKTANVSQIVIGENTSINYTITLRNIGNCIAYNLTITDTLPNGFTTSGSTTFHLDNLTNGSEQNFSVIAYSNIQITEGNAINRVNVEFHAENMTGEKSRTSTTQAIPIVRKAPNLIVNKSVNDTSIYVNEEVNFTINITNIGAGDAINITLSDVLPPFLENTSPINSTCPNLVQGESCVISFTAKAISEGNAKNKIDVTYKDISGAPKYTSNYSSNIIATVPGPILLNVTKTLITTGQILTGDNVFFQINITNIGTETAYNISITDALTCSGFSATVNINDGNISTNQTYTINFTLSGARQGNCTNKVSVTAKNSVNESWIFSDNVSFEVKEPIFSPVPITVKKNIETTATWQNLPMSYQSDIVNFTINITNTGNETITRLDILDGIPTQSENLSPTSEIIDNLNIAPNASFIWNITLKIKQNASIGDAINIVTVIPYANLTQGASVSDSITFWINAKSSFTIDATPTINGTPINESIPVGTQFNLTINFTNPSDANATDTIITIQLPPNVNYSAPLPQGCNATFNETTNITTITCNLGNLTSGNGSSINIPLIAIGPGDAEMNVSICAPNATCSNTSARISILGEANITASKFTDTTTAEVGAISYTIYVKNLGPGPASNVNITDIFPAGSTFIHANVTPNYTDNTNYATWIVQSMNKGD